MERGFTQLLATLIIALTIGVAVPAVALACALAAAVQLVCGSNEALFVDQ